MVEFVSIDATSPLVGLPTAGGDAPFALREVWPFAATQIAFSRAIDRGELAKALGAKSIPKSTAEGVQTLRSGARLLPLAPDRVLHVGEAALGKAEAKAATGLGAYVLDLTPGRVLLSLRGPDWRWVLMKGGGLDFEAMQPGDVAQTSLFKVSTLLWVESADEVYLMPSYTYARALVEKLLDAGTDTGLQLTA